MSLKQFKKILTDKDVPESVSRNFDNLEKILLPITSTELLEGSLLTDVDLTSTVSHVAHKLGRAYKGWLVVDQTSAAIIYRDTTSTQDTSLFLSLRSSINVTVKLWVF